MHIDNIYKKTPTSASRKKLPSGELKLLG